MEQIKVRITGEAPILMHNGQLANPLNKHAKRLKALTSKRQKSDEDHAAVMHAEWLGGLYINDQGPFVPCDNLEAALKAAAKQQKLGKKFGSGVQVIETEIPLQYEGPRDAEGLWLQEFWDIRAVKVGTARVQRCRPLFKEWSCTFTVAYDPRDVNRREVEQAIHEAGRVAGLFDRRPEKGGRFGKFSAEILA
jgi:hypothetical protein